MYKTTSLIAGLGALIVGLFSIFNQNQSLLLGVFLVIVGIISILYFRSSK